MSSEFKNKQGEIDSFELVENQRSVIFSSFTVIGLPQKTTFVEIQLAK